MASTLLRLDSLAHEKHMKGCHADELRGGNQCWAAENPDDLTRNVACRHACAQSRGVEEFNKRHVATIAPVKAFGAASCSVCSTSRKLPSRMAALNLCTIHDTCPPANVRLKFGAKRVGW